MYEARLAEYLTVSDLIENGEWIWPSEWISTFSWINNIRAHVLIDRKTDCAIWKENNDKSVKFSIRILWEIFKENKPEISWNKDRIMESVKDKVAKRLWDTDWRKVVDEIAKKRCSSSIGSVLNRLAIATTLMGLKVKNSDAVKKMYISWPREEMMLFKDHMVSSIGRCSISDAFNSMSMFLICDGDMQIGDGDVLEGNIARMKEHPI
ncbi:hypothetical protein Tco_1294266 [Tanacetum coccineum]